MHFPNWTKLLCAMLLAAGLGWWLRESPLSETIADTLSSQRPVVKRADSTSGPYIGSTSCAAARCHGGPYDSQRPAWSSAYNVWRADDPHARAYADLLTPRGRQIAARYFINEPTAQAEHDARCLACHLTPHTPAAAALSEGVGCESCHGPSQAWRGEHYLNSWKTKRSPAGFHDLRPLDERAKSCVGCHVGAPNQEVNHDLIAAGHPALRFELGAFHEQLPKHWDAAYEVKKHPDIEARLWRAGQLASSRAALELSIHRIRNSQGSWPELAEYDCESCHHPLAAVSWRQTSAASRDGTATKFGRPLWGTWYFSTGVTRAAELLPSDSLENLAVLRTQLSRLKPVSAENLTPANDMLKQMKRPTSSAETDWDSVVRGIEAPATGAADQTFSAAAQRWLALAALAEKDESNVENAMRSERLKAFRSRLAFPAKFDPTATDSRSD